MRFAQAAADVFVPSGSDPLVALARTSHLAIGAHQDDLEIFAYHGIAECRGRAGCSFTGVVVTDGGGSPRSGPWASCTDEEMKRVRRDEQRRAAELGGYGLMIQLAHPSASIRSPGGAVVDDLERIVAGCAPEIVYLHNPVDRHDTHIAVLARSLEAIRRLPAGRRPRRVLGCEVWRDLDWVPDHRKVALPVDAEPELARALIAVFASQIAGGKRYDLAVEGRRRAHATFHQSHATDSASALTFAVDLTPLLDDGAPDLAAFAAGLVDELRADALARIARVGG